MTTEIVTSSELAEARAKLYQFLSSAYIRPPDREFLRLLRWWVTSPTEGFSQLLSEQMKHGLTRLGDFLKKAEQSHWEKLEEAISVEFTRLLRGVKQHYSPPPPYESVYREEGGRVFGELSVEVHREYRRFGLDLVSGLENEPPDHISFELEFMHLLCRQEAEAWERDDEDKALKFLGAEKAFSEEHLLTWLHRFCDEVKKYDRLGLFGGLADLTEVWVSFDYHQPLQDTDHRFYRT